MVIYGRRGYEREKFTRSEKVASLTILGLAVVLVGSLWSSFKTELSAMRDYSQLPQIEIIRSYDADQDRKLSANELTNLLRDYELIKR